MKARAATTEWHEMQSIAMRLARRGFSLEEIRESMREWVDDAVKAAERQLEEGGRR